VFLNREISEMPQISGKPLILLVILAVALGGSHGTLALGETIDFSKAVTAGFDSWAESLETDTGIDSSFEFPFGTPRVADLDPQELKIVLSLRKLVLKGNIEDLESLADQVERRQGEIPAQMRFWLAYAQGKLDQKQACLNNLQLLLVVEEGWQYLDKGQQAWVLTGTPDLLFLLDNRELAARMYARLATSSVPQLNLWGQYQLAGMDFLVRDFDQASKRYRMVCEAEPGTWREHACAMAEIAGRLSRLGREGEPDGAVASANP
jgi:hypothetical protein